jgi:lysophospholipase L1-like esterase
MTRTLRLLSTCLLALGIALAAPAQSPAQSPAQTPAAAPVAATPNESVVPVSREAKSWVDRHQQKLGRVQQGHCDLLFVGDSITHNYEKNGPAPDEVFSPTWEFFYSARNAINLGFGGDETGNVLWRLQQGEVDGIKPKVTVVLIGTNDTKSLRHWSQTQTLGGIQAVVAELHSRLPQTKILLLGILPSDITPAKSAEDAQINTDLARIYAHSKFVTVLDIGQIFMKDGKLDTSLFYDPRYKPAKPALHPDTHGQAMMAAAIEPTLSRLLHDTNRLTIHPNPLDPPAPAVSK